MNARKTLEVGQKVIITPEYVRWYEADTNQFSLVKADRVMTIRRINKDGSLWLEGEGVLIPSAPVRFFQGQ